MSNPCNVIDQSLSLGKIDDRRLRGPARAARSGRFFSVDSISDYEPGAVTQVIGLFPVPLMRVERLLSGDLISSFIDQIRKSQTTANSKSDRLSHTPIASPQSKPMFQQVSKLVVPKLAEFGELLFGETPQWSIKEIWVNVLEAGGRQAIHIHANSFISGVVYLGCNHGCV